MVRLTRFVSQLVHAGIFIKCIQNIYFIISLTLKSHLEFKNLSALLSKKNLLIHDFFLYIIIKNSASKNKIIDSIYFEENLCFFFSRQ